VTLKKYLLTMNLQYRVIWLGDGSTSGSYWRIELTDGTTEGGSSGAPQLDQNKRVVGQNRGGFQGCPNPSVAKYYGRFNLSWNGGGTNSTRLRNWLDPDNTGTLTLDGMDDPYPYAPRKFCHWIPCR
jgi:lysyl endopeptidase